MIVRLFDPEGIDPKDYKSRYPELDETPEFKNFNGKQLVFMWYYANPTSPLVDTIQDSRERVEEALKMSQWRVQGAKKEKILNLQFDEDMYEAIDRMGQYEPGARYIAWKGVQKIFKKYEKIIDAGEEPFKIERTRKDGSKEKEINYDKYVKVTTDIWQEYPKLIEQLERGFGISVIKNSQDDDTLDGGLYIRDWNLNKQNQ